MREQGRGGLTIVVCIKQVPDTYNVKIDSVTGRLIREGIPNIVNPEDMNGLELALQLREKHKGKVIVVSMGPPQADLALREALAMGADEAILLSDRAFAGADTWATAYTLGKAVNKIENEFEAVDLVICGRQAIDGDTAQVGPQLAECLGIPQVTYCEYIEVNMQANKAIVKRATDDGHVMIGAMLPLLVAVTSEANKPRYPTIGGITDAFRMKSIKVWGLNDICADNKLVGTNGSPTQVKRIFSPEPKTGGAIIKGSLSEISKKLTEILKDKVLPSMQ